MPAVGMRRSMRVFVPKSKGGKGVRVLRSGRRLWVDSSGDRNLKGGGGGTGADAWLRLIDDNNGNGWCEAASPKQGGEPMVLDGEEEAALNLAMGREPSSSGDGAVLNKRFGNFYSRRKRKSFGGESSQPLADSHGGNVGKDKMYRLHYVRRLKKRRNLGGGSSSYTSRLLQDGLLALSVLIEPHGARSGRFDIILNSILRRMIVAKVGLEGLSAFLMSDPIVGVFALHGINFFRNWQCTESSGFCVLFGTMLFIPLFTVHFSAVPLSFVYLHQKMLHRSLHLSFALGLHMANMQRADHGRGAGCCADDLQCVSIHNKTAEMVIHGHVGVIHEETSNGDLQDMDVDVTLGVAKIASQYQNLRCRVSNSTRTAHKRRRRSLRTRRARNLSPFGLHRSNGSILPNHFIVKKNTLPDSSATNNSEPKRIAHNNPSTDIKVMKAISIASNEDIDSVSCSGNILVIESDKCYRDEGASIILETNDSNEWVLAVKKAGLTKYWIKPPKDIKPNSINRFTHAVMWAGESGWKLEFRRRQEWAIFKGLAQACIERNLVSPSPVSKTIPVPGVQEVSLVPAPDVAAFIRPDSYIKLTDDELSRAFSRRTANYDMDSEDEQWLNGFNSEFNSLHEPFEHVSVEIFELIIDAFEKASYYSPEDNIDLKAALDLCADLSSKDAVEAVYTYWVKKRAEKRAPLLRVFLLHQPTRPQVIAKPVLRKKRSLKRQTSYVARCGKGKDRSILEAMALKAQEEQMMRVQEARASAKRAEEVAISKRQRAQFLMKNADLAMYRAAIALSIADAAQVAPSARAATHFLD
ncbi:hypothetical protein Dimus_021325 [Dionaea muscipula]